MVRGARMAAFGVVVALSGAARADDLVPSKVVNAWKQAGAFGESVTPHFIFDNQTIALKLPVPPRVAQCMHIAIIGDRGIGFRARLEDAIEDPLTEEDGKRAGSNAGAAELISCGQFPKRAYIQSHSGRGALDVVVAFGPRDLPSVQAVLPDRAPGPRISMRDVPGGGDQTPLAQRIAAADARALNDGYAASVKSMVSLGDDGTAELSDFLKPGCHLIGVFSPDAPRLARKIDLDAEIRDLEEARVLARDRSEAPDAKIEVCLASSKGKSLFVSGGPPGTRVAVSHAMAPLPMAVSALWGEGPQSAFATAMMSHHLKDPIRPPIYVAMGASGNTSLPLAVEPAGCYVAIATRLRGGLRALSLRARVGLTDATDARGGSDAALVSFCTGDRSSVDIDIEARGTSLAWGLMVFRMASGQWGAR